MTTMEVGQQLVELCRNGEIMKAVELLYSPDIVSIEPQASPGASPETHGLDGIKKKNQWWTDNHIIHSAICEGPYPHGDRFVVRFDYEVTNKSMNQRFKMAEAALYTVKDGKIVKEEFFYSMG